MPISDKSETTLSAPAASQRAVDTLGEQNRETHLLEPTRTAKKEKKTRKHDNRKLKGNINEPDMHPEADKEASAASVADPFANREIPSFESYNRNKAGLTVSEEDDSWLKLLYFWADAVMWKGFVLGWRGEAMEADDLLLLSSDEEAVEAYQFFKPRWEAELARVQREGAAKNDPTIEPWLFLTLIVTYKRNMWLGALGLLFSDATNFVAPFLLRELVNWLSDVVESPATTNSWEGYVWAVAIMVNQYLISFSLNTSRFYTTKAFCQMKSSVAMAVFEKASRLEADNALFGLAVQLHTTDSAKFLEMALFFQQIWASTFLTTACLIAMYYFVGWAGVLSIGCVVLFVPLQAFATSQTATLRRQSMAWADARLQSISELLFGIRIVKFMGWEEPLRAKVEAIRAKELALYAPIYIWRTVMNVLMAFQPPFISFGVFALAYAFDDPINPKNVFPAMCMLSVLGIPMIMFPLSIAKIVDLSVSLRRIGEFLTATEKQVYLLTDTPLGDAAIVLGNVTCQYFEPAAASGKEENGGEKKTDKNERSRSKNGSKKEKKPHRVKSSDADNVLPPHEGSSPPHQTSTQSDQNVTLIARDILTNISLRIPKRKLTVIVGATGCGKSTLINAMLGEARVTANSIVQQDGTVAYVPQEAWMMNATVRNNILMGKEFDEALYIKTVKACQLMADLKQLKASDMTEIGERGINVSGGQKQRVAFARAVYSDRDIIIMDDPLSAVDAHVAAALFDHCICEALADKTRVLVTHHVQFLPKADNIIVMGDRCIEFVGTWEELMRSGMDLSARLAEGGHGTESHHHHHSHHKKIDAKKKNGIGTADTSATSTRQNTHTLEDALHATLDGEDGADEAEEMRRQQSNDNADCIPPPKEDVLMTEEEIKAGGIDFKSLRWFYASQGSVVVGLMVFFFSLWRAVGVMTDLLLSWWSTRSDVIGYTNLTDRQYLQWFGTFVAIQFLFLMVRQVPFVIASWSAAKEMHNGMLSRLLKAPTSFYDTTPAGRILARFSKDVEVVDLVIPEALNYCYSMAMMVLGVFALVCYASRWLIILIVVIVVAYWSLWRYYTVTNRAQKRIESASRSPLASVITQTMSGLSTIRSYNSLGLFDVMHTRAVNAHSRANYSWRATCRWLSMRIDVVSCIVVIVVCVVACKVVSSGETYADRVDLLSVFSLAVTYTITISGSVAFLATLATDVESFFTSVERCYAYAFEVPQERDIVYGEEIVVEEEDDAHTDGTDGGEEKAADSAVTSTRRRTVTKCFHPPPSDWPSRGAVSFRSVCLRYAPDKPQVLKQVSFEIKPKEKVGIVGRTGSGKSTLMLALFRMVEIESGVIAFDDVDIQTVTMKDLRRSLTIIPQDPMLFQGTIRSNLDPFDLSTDEEVWESLKKVGMKERIDEDGRGLRAIVTEKGNNFSVGQRQLLCLARALLKKCKILLLDEATASVDFESDAMIQKTIRNEFKDCTVLTIAHRLATIIDSDKVLLMDHGVAAEFATPYSLLCDPSSQFHSMVSALGAEQFEALVALAKERDDAHRQQNCEKD